MPAISAMVHTSNFCVAQYIEEIKRSLDSIENRPRVASRVPFAMQTATKNRENREKSRHAFAQKWTETHASNRAKNRSNTRIYFEARVRLF